ncbi:MAG: hypothetical protein MI892_24510 [Desulfobacterales bacterium]|nr:hypothetical protein [Desulfobacterales bacterium]
MKTQKPLSIKIVQFTLSMAFIWLLTFKILPFITSVSSNARQLADFIDTSGIETGQFYYTGVEIITQAESSARGAVFFTNQQKSENTGSLNRAD